jgi:hypothetical protein
MPIQYMIEITIFLARIRVPGERKDEGPDGDFCREGRAILAG